MIADEPTLIPVRWLRQQGWSPTGHTAGSHTRWACSIGMHAYAVPDGHRTISAGVLRNIRKHIATCDCQEKAI